MTGEPPSLDDLDALTAWHRDQLGFGPDAIARGYEQTDEYQRQRWGATGLAILAIAEDEEALRREAEWAALDDLDDITALIGQL